MSETLSCCVLPEDAPFRSAEDVIRHLDGLGLFHMDMGLGRMQKALSTLGLDRFHCPAIQVVGTNGKGSTSAFLQSIAMAHGMNAGLYTSPHFVHPQERIRLNSACLPLRAWPAFASQAVQAEPGLTYFELLTVMAAQAFQTSDADLMIFEAGLGGRYDATTALPADMVCFAPIGMDHMNILGNSLNEIADDKSDTIRPGVRMVISAPQADSVRDILIRKADANAIPLCSQPFAGDCDGSDKGISLWFNMPSSLRECAELPQDAILGLKGPHQRMNAQTAVLAWVLLCHAHGWKTDRKTIARGLKRAFIPGRLQYVPAENARPALWLDGAHNAHGMKALIEAVQSMEEAERPGAVIFSCLADKEPEKLIALLLKAVGKVPVFVPTIANNPRAAEGAFLASLIGEQARSTGNLTTAIDAAAKAASGRPVLICGSLYLLGDVFAMWPEMLQPQED